MTTYVYETIPQKPGQKPEYFELQQGMNEAPLTKHPKSGQPVRRVVLGGYGVLKADPPPKPPKGGGCCCGSGGECD